MLCIGLFFTPDALLLLTVDPAEALQFPMEYLERVKKVHSEGGYGSQG